MDVGISVEIVATGRGSRPYCHRTEWGTEQAGGGKSPHGKALEGDGNAGNTKLLVSACMGH